MDRAADSLTSEGPVGPIQSLPVAQVYTSLATRPQGLSASEAAERLRRFGKNAIREVRGRPLLLRLVANFTHVMAILLWVGGVVALVAGMPELAIAIWMVNVINGAFSFWQEYRAESAAKALRQLMPHYTAVLRDGAKQRILAEELVPGDVVLLSEGDRISADARLVHEADLQIDQSTFTGEAHPIRKTSEAILRTKGARPELRNLVFAGTSVVAGNGTAVVFGTGMESEFGKVAHLTQSIREQPSPLQKEMVHVTRLVTVLAVSIGLGFFALLAVLPVGFALSKSFIFALGLLVAFVPEGLSPTVSLALAMAVQRMVRRNVLVKKLSAVETLGCTTVICTDKTGTLTQNEMTVCDLWLSGRGFRVSGTGYAPDGAILEHGHVVRSPVEGDLRQLLHTAALCNNARILPPSGEVTRWTVLGDPTEAALLTAALKGKLDLKKEAEDKQRVRELPFDSQRKRMTTLHQTEHGLVAYVKGSPREVLSLSQRILIDGQEQPLDQSWRNRITETNDAYAGDGLRVLAVAMRRLPEETDSPAGIEEAQEAIERELTFLGLVAMSDPPRPEVSSAVDKCYQAGIRIIMITGDYGLTAESIGRRVGMIHHLKPRIVNGTDLDEMTDAALKEALDGEVIFARVAPGHKLRVVEALQDLGHVVAVTGDGVNDAPALKKADIGVAMGVAGTDVAKEAADMILTDDNFASIVSAVEEGRGVYANIKKFITYIFTSNCAEAVPFIVFAFSGSRIPLPLGVMEVLSIDLGADIMPGLALGVDPPEPGVMESPPRSLNEHVISRPMLIRAFIWLGLIQGILSVAAFYFQYWKNGYWGQWLDLPSEGSIYMSATAMTLAAIVVMQMGNLFAQRSVRTSFFRTNPFTNVFIWIGVAVALAIVAIVVYVPFFQGLFETAAFPAENWLFLLALAPVLLLIDETRKAVVRWREGRNSRR